MEGKYRRRPIYRHLSLTIGKTSKEERKRNRTLMARDETEKEL